MREREVFGRDLVFYAEENVLERERKGVFFERESLLYKGKCVRKREKRRVF